MNLKVDTPVNPEQDRLFMARALQLAAEAESAGEVPVGAVVVRDGELLGEGYNQPLSCADPTAHAEIVALRRAAAAVGNYRLPGTTVYVTIEPCLMCLGAMVHARVQRLVFGAAEPRAGVVVSQLRLLDQNFFNHRVTWTGGVLAEACSAQIANFFRRKRGR